MRKYLVTLLTLLAFAVMFNVTANLVAQEPVPILELTISDTARVVDHDNGIYVVGTTTGRLYVIDEAGQYTVTNLGVSEVRDVRIEGNSIAVATGWGCQVILLSLDGSLTPTELWRRSVSGWEVSSVDLSADGEYVAYLARYGSVGVFNRVGSLVASYSISGSWISWWLDATDDMEYIAVTLEVPPYYGVSTGVELYRFDGASLNKVWSRVLVYGYETTEVRVSENKDYVAVATSSGTIMNLLDLPTGNVLWAYDAGKEQFACDGDENLEYVIGATQAWSPPYSWFIIDNQGSSYTILAQGNMEGPKLNLSAYSRRYCFINCFAFG